MHSEPKAYEGEGNYIFVSYSHKDNERVYPFISILQEKYNVWFDEGLKYGVDFNIEIAKKIETCDAFIYMVSMESLVSEYCQKEFHYARRIKKKFVTVLMDETTYNAVMNLPADDKTRWFIFEIPEQYQLCTYHTFRTDEKVIKSLEEKLDIRSCVADVPAKTEGSEKTETETGITVKEENKPEQTSEQEITENQDKTENEETEKIGEAEEITAEENRTDEKAEKIGEAEDKNTAENRMTEETETRKTEEEAEKERQEAEEQAKREAEEAERIRLIREENKRREEMYREIKADESFVCYMMKPKIKKSVPAAFILPAASLISSVAFLTAGAPNIGSGFLRVILSFLPYLLFTVLTVLICKRICRAQYQSESVRQKYKRDYFDMSVNREIYKLFTQKAAIGTVAAALITTVVYFIMFGAKEGVCFMFLMISTAVEGYLMLSRANINRISFEVYETQYYWKTDFYKVRIRQNILTAVDISIAVMTVAAGAVLTGLNTRVINAYTEDAFNGFVAFLLFCSIAFAYGLFAGKSFKINKYSLFIIFIAVAVMFIFNVVYCCVTCKVLPAILLNIAPLLIIAVTVLAGFAKPSDKEEF